MRTYIRTLVTLNTFFRIPFRYVNCSASLFISGCSKRCCTVFNSFECAYRKRIAFTCINCCYNSFNIFRLVFSNNCFCIYSVSPFSGNFNLNNAFYTLINSSVVHVKDIVAFLTVRLLDSSLHIFNSVSDRNDVSKLEECSLKNCINSVSETDFSSYIRTVDDIELNVVICKIFLH